MNWYIGEPPPNHTRKSIVIVLSNGLCQWKWPQTLVISCDHLYTQVSVCIQTCMIWYTHNTHPTMSIFLMVVPMLKLSAAKIHLPEPIPRLEWMELQRTKAARENAPSVAAARHCSHSWHHASSWSHCPNPPNWEQRDKNDPWMGCCCRWW